jgi:hypothetical protein
VVAPPQLPPLEVCKADIERFIEDARLWPNESHQALPLVIRLSATSLWFPSHHRSCSLVLRH